MVLVGLRLLFENLKLTVGRRGAGIRGLFLSQASMPLTRVSGLGLQDM